MLETQLSQVSHLISITYLLMLCHIYDDLDYSFASWTVGKAEKENCIAAGIIAARVGSISECNCRTGSRN